MPHSGSRHECRLVGFRTGNIVLALGLSVFACSLLSPRSACAQGVYAGYAVPLDGGTGGLEAGGGFRYEFLPLPIGMLGVEGRVTWNRTTLGSALPGQQSKWLAGDFLRIEALGVFRFLDDWLRPFVIAGPALLPAALEKRVRSKAAGETAELAAGPTAPSYHLDGYDLGAGFGVTVGVGTEVWLWKIGISAEVRVTALFGRATLNASPPSNFDAPGYRGTGDYTMHVAVLRVGLLYGGFGTSRKSATDEPD